jgi:hypothetical protein
MSMDRGHLGVYCEAHIHMSTITNQLATFMAPATLILIFHLSKSEFESTFSS